VTTSLQESVLIFWDIDHTLLTIGNVSREIYEAAFEEVVGQPLRELADMTGRTERAILAETLALHGVSDPERKFVNAWPRLGVDCLVLRRRLRH
jgi:hypothetical protein